MRNNLSKYIITTTTTTSLIRILCITGGWNRHFQFHSFCSSSPTIFQCYKPQLLYFTISHQANWVTGAGWVHAGCNSWHLYPKRQGWALVFEVCLWVICMWKPQTSL